MTCLPRQLLISVGLLVPGLLLCLGGFRDRFHGQRQPFLLVLHTGRVQASSWSVRLSLIKHSLATPLTSVGSLRCVALEPHPQRTPGQFCGLLLAPNSVCTPLSDPHLSRKPRALRPLLPCWDQAAFSRLLTLTQAANTLAILMTLWEAHGHRLASPSQLSFATTAVPGPIVRVSMHLR